MAGNFSASERNEIRGWVRDQVAKGKKGHEIVRDARKKFGGLNWIALIKLILQILEQLNVK